MFHFSSVLCPSYVVVVVVAKTIGYNEIVALDFDTIRGPTECV